MRKPALPLGVPLMDDDHARIEEALAHAAARSDGELLSALSLCRDELAEHFAREEELMEEARLPVLACHVAQHRRLLEDVDATLAAKCGDPVALRAYLERDLPNLVMAHIGSVDMLSARFLSGDLSSDATAALRLPQEDRR